MKKILLVLIFYSVTSYSYNFLFFPINNYYTNNFINNNLYFNNYFQGYFKNIYNNLFLYQNNITSSIYYNSSIISKNYFNFDYKHNKQIYEYSNSTFLSNMIMKEKDKYNSSFRSRN
ncbi:hypothetical protein [Brachyspira sp. SAP_772]|uniref:hypothetical protein n=1 Tax=Brachyspira sp. SAP_772 TaxID=2608385 RepID=UPI0012F521B8|nr:hypothetical protein [Brachyspira sp. SAP_772]